MRWARTCWAKRSRALMKILAERRAELYAEGLKRIAASRENDYRKFLLAVFLEAYSDLDDAQGERVQALMHAEADHEAETLMKATYGWGGGTPPDVLGAGPDYCDEHLRNRDFVPGCAAATVGRSYATPAAYKRTTIRSPR